LKLKTLAELAAVGAFLIVVLQYMKVEPNAIDELPSLIQDAANKDVAELKLEVDEESYLKNGSIAYPMYKAAMAISYGPDKSDALEKAATVAVKEKDYKLAILAATNITYSPDMNKSLTKIAESAILDKGTVGYAIVAAEYISYSPDKTKVLQKITKVYEHIANGGDISDPSLFEKSGIDAYKEIFIFADSSAYIGLSSKEAKEFTESWLATRNHKDFLLFKQVFIFADSSAYLGKNTEESLEFALSWIDEYSEKDFSVFRETFIFANSGAYLDLDEPEAIKFAFKKVHESKAANKSSKADAEKRAAS